MEKLKKKIPPLDLFVLEKGAEPELGNVLHGAQSGVAKALRGRNFGSGQGSSKMRLDARMSCAKRALRFRFGAAHRARHG